MAVLVLALLSGLGGSGDENVTLVNATPALQRHVQAALTAFADHGLPLPEVAEVRFDPHHPFCERHGGRYSAPESSVLLCYDADTMIIGTDERMHRAERRLLLHELAHAWTETNTTTDQQEEFMRLHGVHRWNDGHDRWHQRGTEIAAETFVWVLSDADVVPRSIASVDPDLLRQGFAILTGLDAG